MANLLREKVVELMVAQGSDDREARKFKYALNSRDALSSAHIAELARDHSLDLPGLKELLSTGAFFEGLDLEEGVDVSLLVLRRVIKMAVLKIEGELPQENSGMDQVAEYLNGEVHSLEDGSFGPHELREALQLILDDLQPFVGEYGTSIVEAVDLEACLNALIAEYKPVEEKKCVRGTSGVIYLSEQVRIFYDELSEISRIQDEIKALRARLETLDQELRIVSLQCVEAKRNLKKETESHDAFMKNVGVRVESLDGLEKVLSEDTRNAMRIIRVAISNGEDAIRVQKELLASLKGIRQDLSQRRNAVGKRIKGERSRVKALNRLITQGLAEMKGSKPSPTSRSAK